MPRKKRGEKDPSKNTRPRPSYYVYVIELDDRHECPSARRIRRLQRGAKAHGGGRLNELTRDI